jgi:hypothetical protein
MELNVNKITPLIINFFTLLITLFSFILLALQITFISIIWMFIHYLTLINNRLSIIAWNNKPS